MVVISISVLNDTTYEPILLLRATYKYIYMFQNEIQVKMKFLCLLTLK